MSVFQPKTTGFLMCICLVLTTSFEAGSKAFGEDKAPPSPDKSWRPPQLNEYENALAHGDFTDEGSGSPVKIDPKKAYDLPELIDVAERSNPETRIAWEQARQAAKVVGLSESSYYPYLAASAASGYQHQLAVLQSAFLADAAEQNVALDMKWLLFDFGGREAFFVHIPARLEPRAELWRPGRTASFTNTSGVMP